MWAGRSRVYLPNFFESKAWDFYPEIARIFHREPNHIWRRPKISEGVPKSSEVLKKMKTQPRLFPLAWEIDRQAWAGVRWVGRKKRVGVEGVIESEPNRLRIRLGITEIDDICLKTLCLVVVFVICRAWKSRRVKTHRPQPYFNVKILYCCYMRMHSALLSRLRPPPPVSHVKMTGALVVSLWGANHGFWSHLRCSGRNSHIFSCQDIF